MLRKEKIDNLNRKKKKGQSTVEYLILFAAIGATAIVFLGPSGIFRQALNDTYTQGTDGMVNMANRLRASH